MVYMWLLLAAIYSFSYFVQSEAAREKCYEEIGCFSCKPPFINALYRPTCRLPVEGLSVRFLLYTRTKPNEAFYLKRTNDSISNSSFDGSLPTKIIIPGFNTTLETSPEFLRIKDELLKESPYNVIIVDWTDIDNYPYVQAIANGRVVAGRTALLLKTIKENKGINYKSIHIIGHSLGAHIAGWIGERLNKVGRITGLDPAGPYFQLAPKIVRLDPSDADFVDIIHTNGAESFIEGLGLFQTIGHADFFPNGGKLQPACGRSTIFNIVDTRTCAHSMSLKYFRSSIRECRFPAVNCESYIAYKSGLCNCNNSILDNMGFHAKKINADGSPTLKFYLHTYASSPYCHKTDCPDLENQNQRKGFVLFSLEKLLSKFLSSVRGILTFLYNLGNSLYSFAINLF